MDEEQRKLLESLSRLAGASDELSDTLQAQMDNYNILLVGGDKEQAARARSEAIITKTNQAYEQQMRSLGLTKNALGEYERITVQLTAEQRKRIAEEQTINERQQSRDKATATYHSMMADKTSTLIKGLSAFSEGLNKTVFDSTRGQSKYGEVLDGAGDKIQKIGALFGPFGKAVTFATGGLLKLAGAALKQQEQLNKAYETLSEFGAVDASGIEGMFKNLQNAGFVMKDMDKFSGILKAAGPNLATLGTTAADGAKVFAESMGKIKNTNAEKELRMLGFTTESMAKSFADYQGMMGRMGFLQGKSTSEIAKKSVDYAKTLDELSKLTGESRDEMQKRMDADANDIKFRLKLQEVSEKDRERLQKASALIADFGEDTASGFREMVANNGQVVGEASTKLMLSTGNAAKQIVEDLNAGKISHIEAARLVAEAKAQQVERFREVGKLDAEIMRELGLTVKDMDAINKYRGKTQEEVERMDKERELQMKGELDSQRANEVQRQITERNAEQAKDRLTNMIGKTMVSAFEVLHKVMNGFAKRIAELLAKIGGPDFTDLFMSTEDIANNIKETSSQLDKTNKEISKINEAKATVAAKEKAYIDSQIEINALREKLGKESNAEARKALQEEISQKQKQSAVLRSEANAAATIARRGTNRLKNLEKEKEELEKKKSDQEKKLAAAGGVPSEAKESSQIEKIRNDQQALLDERKKYEELITDKTKTIYQQTLESMNLKEEDLKDAEKKKEFEQKYSEARKVYADKRIEIDRKIEDSEKQIAKIKKDEVDATLARAKTPAMVAGGAPGVGGETPSQKSFLNKMSSTGVSEPQTPPPAANIPQDKQKNLQGITAALKKRGITDENYIKATLGNVMKESGGVARDENLNYSKTSNERIKSIFGSRATRYSDEELSEIKKDPQRMAEVMYGGEYGKKNLGNIEAGDAWKFRGRGYIGLTGRTNYAAASKAIYGDDRLLENPDLVNSPEIASEVVAWFMEKSKSSMQKSMGLGSGDMTAEQANLLATSQIAGGDVRKRGSYLSGELLGKVTSFASGMDKAVLQTASTGGMFSGPESGYPVLLHGNEMVIPTPNVGDLSTALASVTKTALGEMGPSTQTNTAPASPMMDQFMTLQADLMNMIAQKLDQLDSRLAKSNDIQENILTYSAA